MGRKLRNFGITVLSLAAFFTLINVVPPAKSVNANPFIKGENEKVMIAAHRGGADTNPENTLLAYRAAVNEYKVDILESDLYLTKDGYLVYNHDSYVDETCNINGDISYEEMDALMYKIEGEDLYLIGTSEHSMIGKFKDQILKKEDLPVTQILKAFK